MVTCCAIGRQRSRVPAAPRPAGTRRSSRGRSGGAGAAPYRGSGALSLRDNADEITGRLSAELANRVASAGVHIIESRLTRLSYAPEIAQAMLRQQQASAVVGARSRIVEGAVGMVKLALERGRGGSAVGRSRCCR